MKFAVLHVLDPTTTVDGLEMLAALLKAHDPGVHSVVVMGLLATTSRAIAVGIPPDCIEHVHSAGAFDPTGWLALHRIIRRNIPSYLHAWGFRGIVAGAAVRSSTLQRIATFTIEPDKRGRKWLKRASRCSQWLWLATSEHIAQQIGGPGTDIRHISPGIRTNDPPTGDADTLRKELGIRPNDGPIVLLGGEITEPAARQNYGLWAGAILQQIFPALRILIHTGPSQPLSLRQEIRSVRQLAATAPTPDFVIYSAPDMSWRDLLQVADVMVATPDKPISINSILWAMAAKVPVVATPTPQMQALIEDGRTGLLAEVNKPRAIAACLEQLLSNQELGVRLAAAAHQHIINNHNSDRMVEQLRNVYALELEEVTAA